VAELLSVAALNGLVYGLLLFMLSSGMTLIFSMMGVLNFAHASFYMLGAYFAYQISTAIGFWPALLIAPLAVALLGAGVERLGLRRVHQHGHVAELLFTFGVALIIQELVQIVWGRLAKPYRVPESLSFTAFHLFSTGVPAYRLFMMVIAVAMFVGLYLVLVRTRTGIIIQAAVTHPQMVGMLGHDVPRIYSLVFGLGCGMAGLAGVIAGNTFNTAPDMAALLGGIVFVVVIVGGLGSLTGALVASLLIGVLQTFMLATSFSAVDLLASVGWALGPDTPLYELWSMKSSHAAPLLPYVLMVLMLAWRPQGLFGRRL
jgi:branched-chain amino acid transport system permease protein